MDCRSFLAPLLRAVSASFALLLLVNPVHGAERPFGLTKRVPWTTSKVVGSPDPPSEYTTEVAFPKLKLNSPTDVEGSPDGKRWFYTEEWGVVRSFANQEDVERAEICVDLHLLGKDEHGNPQQKHRLWSMTFHPRFAENGYLYVCYHATEQKPAVCRISRFEIDRAHPELPHADLASEKIILEWPSREDHFGGCLKFGPDGDLYFSVGDGSGYGDGQSSGQDLSDFQASIHRIDVDHPSPGQNYSVPADNPFVKLAGARPEIWAYGLRNIWKMSFDRQTGELWGADVGQDLWESVFHLEKGGNYGWSVFEGTHTFRPERKLGPTPVLKPVVEHDHSQFRSITGGFVYRGKRLPDLFGNYVYADFETGKIWAFKYDHQHATAHRELADTPLKIVGFGEAADGELLILDYLGHVHRLVKNETRAEHPTSAFPRKLSQTGLFADTKALLPAAGLIPYSVNSPLWSDGAQKARFMAVPGMSKIDYHPTNGWGFPQESVLVKTFSLDLEAGNPASRRRLETRILQLEHNRWRGYTYLWNDEQTDATLLEGAAGLDRKYTIRDAAAPGGKREQVWHYPSRAECTLCHTMPTGYVLGPSTLQLNRDQDYGGTTDNQLRTLEHIGMFKDPILQVEERESPDHRKFISYDQLPKLPDPRDPAAPLEARARSYLHANCAHCHMRSGGGNALFWLPYEKTLAETATLDVLPLHGDLGIPGARLLVAGSPEKSLIYERMLRLDAQRMPRVASSVVDQPAVKLIKEWIKSLPPKLTNGESPEK